MYYDLYESRRHDLGRPQNVPEAMGLVLHDPGLMKSVFVYKSAQSPNTSRSVFPYFNGLVTPSTDNFVCDEVNAIYLVLMTR